MKPNKNGIHIHYELPEGKTPLDVADDFATSVNIHTHGMEKYGLPNICFVNAYEGEVAMDLLNMITDVIIRDKKRFDFKATHYFDNPVTGKTDFVFRFVKVNCSGETCYLAVQWDDEANIPMHIPAMFPDRWKEVGVELIKEGK